MLYWIPSVLYHFYDILFICNIFLYTVGKLLHRVMQKKMEAYTFCLLFVTLVLSLSECSRMGKCKLAAVLSMLRMLNVEQFILVRYLLD